MSYMLPRAHRFLVGVGLSFADPALETQYRAYLVDRVYRIAQVSILLGILSYATYGLFDLTSAGGGLQSTRFRYMLACPVLCSFLALSFTKWARRYWNGLLVCFSVTSILCFYVTLVLVDRETIFRIAVGTATINYGLAMTFIALLPLRTTSTLLVGVILQVAHLNLLLIFSGLATILIVGNCINLAFMFMIVCSIAYARERLLRQEFDHQRKVLDEKDELKMVFSTESLDAITRARESGKAVADAFGEVTVIFIDIADFTHLAERLAPRHLVEILNEIFSALDQLALDCRVERVKTIGDAYMAISGTTDQSRNSAEDAAEFVLKSQDRATALTADTGCPIAFRIGMHTGSLIGGVVGRQRPTYDYWGRTVNIASRLESTGMPGKVQVSEATYYRLANKYDLEQRGPIDLRGIGTVETYFLLGHKCRQ